MYDELIRRHSRHYGPILDEIQAVFEVELGPLAWRDRDDARLLNDHTAMQSQDPMIRVGPVFGCGVATAAFDSATLRDALNRVLTRHGFNELGPVQAEAWGLLHTSANDGYESRLRVELFGYAKAWVDVPVRG